jgi:hypothetical protein
MKFVTRFLERAITILSSVICVAIIVAWLMSYRVQTRIHIHNTTELVDRDLSICTVGGQVFFFLDTMQHVNQDESPWGRQISGESRRLGPGEAAGIVETNGRAIRSQGWKYGGFGWFQNSFQQKNGNWNRMPSNDVMQDRFTCLMLPYWLLAGIALVLPLKQMGMLVWHEIRKAPAGYCKSCGYDLRATPDRCPECGAICGADDSIVQSQEEPSPLPSP